MNSPSSMYIYQYEYGTYMVIGSIDVMNTTSFLVPRFIYYIKIQYIITIRLWYSLQHSQ